MIGEAHKAGWRKPSGLFTAAATSLLNSGAIYNIGTFALPSTLWVAAFIFWWLTRAALLGFHPEADDDVQACSSVPCYERDRFRHSERRGRFLPAERGGPTDRIRAAGYPLTGSWGTAENIAYGQQTAQDVMTGWMNSPGHKANILSANFKELGVGHYVKNGTHYWVQNFGSHQ